MERKIVFVLTDGKEVYDIDFFTESEATALVRPPDAVEGESFWTRLDEYERVYHATKTCEGIPLQKLIDRSAYDLLKEIRQSVEGKD